MKQDIVITQQVFEKEYRKITHVKAITNPEDKHGVIMLAAAVYGPYVQQIKPHLDRHYPVKLIRDCLQRMRKAKIIHHGKLAVGWFGKNGGIAFCLDVACVQGWLKRV